MTPSPTDNLATVAGLEPAAVWTFFAGLANVPRPSKREAKVQQYIRDLAASHGLGCREDAVGNLVLTADATEGCDDAPVTVIQAHLDMVCEKNSGVDFDFDHDAIRLVRDQDGEGADVLRADGTTLGADNGLGVALALAAATAPGIRRGPLEILLTFDEESGMTGALNLDPAVVEGRRLLNLDSEDNALYIGCAGGTDVELSWQLETAAVANDAPRARISVSGLRGGHSGCDIHEGRGNANKLLVRALRRSSIDGLRLLSIDGGNLRNAIPREASALVAVPSATDIETLTQVARDVEAEARRESLEPGAEVRVEAATDEGGTVAVTAADTHRLLDALAALPHGVLGMHPEIPTLVETSSNLASVRSTPTDGGLRIEAVKLSRGSSASRMAEALDRIAAIGALSGAEVATANGYPGWEPNPSSPLLATFRQVHQELFGDLPEVKAIHAGLECGILGERLGDLDMISFGPRIEGAHSPDERVWIGSVERCWRYLVAVLDALAETDRNPS